LAGWYFTHTLPPSVKSVESLSIRDSDILSKINEKIVGYFAKNPINLHNNKTHLHHYEKNSHHRAAVPYTFTAATTPFNGIIEQIFF